MGKRLCADDNFPKLAADDKNALIAITLNLEMSRAYPTRDQQEWDYEKGNLDGVCLLRRFVVFAVLLSVAASHGMENYLSARPSLLKMRIGAV